MATQYGAGFRYTPPGGSLTTVNGLLRLREGSAALVQTRYRSIALDKRTIDTIVIEGGAEEIQGVVRFIDAPAAFRAMLRQGANGVVLSYFPALSAGTSYPFILVSALEDVRIVPDRDRFGFDEWETALTLWRVDGGSTDGLL